MRPRTTIAIGAAAIGTAAGLALAACGGTIDDDSLRSAQPLVPAPGDPPPPASLRTVAVPEPKNLHEVVADRAAAIALGKALFWDMQVGSDGVQACASCHFNAGADSRSKNQTAPRGSARASGPTFEGARGPNHQLRRADFPFHVKSDPRSRTSTALRDSDDIVSSQGVAKTQFADASPGQAEDERTSIADADGFRIAQLNVRRVETRNTPTVINAVFNFRNFWDGRAQAEFNGVNGLGAKDPDAFVFVANERGELTRTKVLFATSSLASQAVEPPLSGTEMSADGRTFVEIGDKLLRDRPRHPGAVAPRRLRRLAALRPLEKQVVDPTDSVLGSLSRAPQPGLAVRSYDQMIRAAFHQKWWHSRAAIEVAADGTIVVLDKPTGAPTTEAYTLMEWNMSLFFGLAIQMYEATLVSDDTPFDRFRAGDAGAMTEQQKLGMFLFASQTRGRCINCHGGPELTDASVTRLSVNHLRRRDGTDIMDFGFNNIGVRPTGEDLGIGGEHPLAPGVILSEARLAFLGRFTDPTLTLRSSDILAVDGAFKVPGLRNVELTAPYFHNGGALTLRQVIEFYSRGGDFHPIRSEAGQTISPLNVLSSTDEEIDAFVAFLRALTDERVRRASAPFDHPQLLVPNGHVLVDDGTGAAVDEILEIPAVGRDGATPLPGFLDGEAPPGP